MDERALYHAVGDRDFFELPWLAAAIEGAPDIAPHGDAVPPGWRRQRHGPWVGFHRIGAQPLPMAGWKVHVSGTPNRAADVLGVVADVCFDLGVAWKGLANQKLVAVSQSKYAPRALSGKVCSVYPVDDEMLAEVLDRLRLRLADEPGPRVVGDIGDPGSPVSLRWGAFRLGWLRGAGGVPVPAVQMPGGSPVADRRIGGSVPATRPSCVREWQARAELAERDETLPVTEVALVHRTNAGAIYTALYAGRPVVLKEARGHSGLASDGSNAVSRLRHEHRVLQHLEGEGVGPTPIDYLSCGGSEFLVMEQLVGQPLSRRVSSGHPAAAILPADTAAEDYYGWAATVVADLAALLDRMHRLGVVHRDLHPDNIVVLNDGSVRLIDFECASCEGVQASTAGGAPGFTFSEDGIHRDRLACERIRLMVHNPVVMVLDRRPGLVETLRRAGAADRRLAVDGTAPRPEGPGPAVEPLVAGIGSAATPHRSDRLYPGSLDHLDVPGGGCGLWTGAAGVQRALSLLGVEVPAAHRRWLLDRPVDVLAGQRGLAFGSDGVALALAGMGEQQKAVEVLRASWRATTLPVCGPSWGFGHAGVALALTELAELLGDADLLNRAEEHLLLAVTAIDGECPDSWAGLLHGFSGTALALLRMGQSAAFASSVDSIRGAVDRCFRLELEGCVASHGYLLGADRRGRLPYLGAGSAALGLVADRMDWRADDPEVSQPREAVLRVLRRPMMVAAGLAEGRAGVLLTLRDMVPDDPMIAVHRDRLAWHVAPRIASAADELYVLGELNLRLSTDVASGSAGVLAVLAGTDVCRELLLLPERPTSVAVGDSVQTLATV